MMATLRSQKKLFIVFAIAVAVMALIFGAWFLLRPAPPPAIIGKLTLALPTQINSAPAIVAHAQGWFKKSGIEVLDQPFLLGKDALNSLLEGKADLAVVAQSDRGIDRVADLKNKTVGLTKGTNLTYFLDALLSVNAVPAGSVTQADMSVKEGNLEAVWPAAVKFAH